MRSYHYTCQGESHKATDKECQDYSCTLSDAEKGLHIAIVCDGHGGDTYFRSAFGAKAAAEAALSAIETFVAQWDYSQIKGLKLTPFAAIDHLQYKNSIDAVFRQLFSSIYSHWLSEVSKDAAERELTEWEIKNVKPEHIQLLKDEERIVKVYGCTLMAYVQTPNYWFAFHLGDGKFVMVDSECVFSQPIPWDDRCFLNQTTSMCDSEPIKEFRYCVCADNTFPIAAFLGSDGIDDTFGDGNRLHNFYGNLLREIHKNGFEDTIVQIQEALPEFSRRGSKDDMSVAFVYDENRLSQVTTIIEKNIEEELQKNLQHFTDAFNEWTEKIASLDLQMNDCEEIHSVQQDARKKAMELEAERCKKEIEKIRVSLNNISGHKQEETLRCNDQDENISGSCE